MAQGYANSFNDVVHDDSYEDQVTRQRVDDLAEIVWELYEDGTHSWHGGSCRVAHGI